MTVENWLPFCLKHLFIWSTSCVYPSPITATISYLLQMHLTSDTHCWYLPWYGHSLYLAKPLIPCPELPFCMDTTLLWPSSDTPLVVTFHMEALSPGLCTDILYCTTMWMSSSSLLASVAHVGLYPFEAPYLPYLDINLSKSCSLPWLSFSPSWAPKLYDMLFIYRDSAQACWGSDILHWATPLHGSLFNFCGSFLW